MTMERIDKIISEQTYYTRKEIKKLISKGMVYVNGEQVKKSETKYDENNINLKINGQEIEVGQVVIFDYNNIQYVTIYNNDVLFDEYAFTSCWNKLGAHT